MEDETALSIIDPVTVNMEVTLKANLSEAKGIYDAVYTSADRTLEVQMQHLCVRLSYHDFRMLSQMLNSVPKQTYKARTQAATEQGSYPVNIRSKKFKNDVHACVLVYFYLFENVSIQATFQNYTHWDFPLTTVRKHCK